MHADLFTSAVDASLHIISNRNTLDRWNNTIQCFISQFTLLCVHEDVYTPWLKEWFGFVATSITQCNRFVYVAQKYTAWVTLMVEHGRIWHEYIEKRIARYRYHTTYTIDTTHFLNKIRFIWVLPKRKNLLNCQACNNDAGAVEIDAMN